MSIYRNEKGKEEILLLHNKQLKRLSTPYSARGSLRLLVIHILLKQEIWRDHLYLYFMEEMQQLHIICWRVIF